MKTARGKNALAADVIVDILLAHGIDTAFGVPGESYLQILNAIARKPSFRFIVCRQEGGAAMAAEAYGKILGKPGVCMVTRGPGAANSTSGIHVAFQDSTPLIVLIGQARRDVLGREAFQEIDFEKFFAPLAKWCVELRDSARVPELLARAIHIATSGRPGPVVVSLPEDILSDEVGEIPILPPLSGQSGAPTPANLDAMQKLLRSAEKPIIVAGGGGWTPEASRRLARFATKHSIPVAAAFRRQDVLDNEDVCYVGHLSFAPDQSLAAAVRDADLIIALGARLGEVTTSEYSLLTPPVPRQLLVHVHPDPNEHGTVFRATLGIVAGIEAALAAFDSLSAHPTENRHAWAAKARRGYEAFSHTVEDASAVQLSQVMRQLRGALPKHAIVTNGAGNYAIWLHRFFSYRQFGTQLAPTCGSMGYGLPAAIAAALARPDTPVICLSGDGCFMMTCQELATAVKYELKIVILLVNNSSYGTIRMHQEREFPGQLSGTTLVNPDFIEFARSFGIFSVRVKRTHDFLPALERALNASGPALIEIPHDVEAIRPGVRLSSFAAAAS